MSVEIERKFLVNGDFKEAAFKQIPIIQAYLSSVKERSVRIRIYGDKGFITIKGQSSETGLSRYEWEKEIPLSEAHDLLKLCEPGRIEKTRYLIKAGLHIFEVDEFEADNAGLLMAEIELTAEDEDFEKPHWLGTEVTGDKRYYNSYLKNHPFKSW